MRTRLHWAVQRGDQIDMQHARITTEEVGEFLERWNGRVPIPEVEAELRRVQAWVNHMERHLEKLFLTHLLEVLELRREWEIAEAFLRASTAFIRIMKEAPAHLLPQLEAIYRNQMHREYDAGTEYQESVAQAEAGEAAYKKTSQEFEVDWGNRFTAALRKRLNSLTLAQTQNWMEEIQQCIEQLDREAND